MYILPCAHIHMCLVTFICVYVYTTPMRCIVHILPAARGQGEYMYGSIYMCYTPCRGGIIDLYHNEDSI